MAQKFLEMQLQLIFVLCFVTNSFDSRAQNSRPLSYLNNLVKSQKGDRLEGLFELKKYLSRIGYIKNTNNHLNNHVDANVFNDELELAIKNYQAFFHIPISGVLDAKTVEHLKKPRCSVPDDVHPNISQFGGNFSSHFAFLPGKPRWPPTKKKLTYSFLPGTQNDIARPIEVSTRAWAKASHFKFAFIKNSNKADIKISFQKKDHGDGFPFVEGVLAHSFEPPDGRLHYNGDEQWVNGVEPGKYDLQTVGMHELGHILGLGHSNDPKAIMFPDTLPGERKGLGQDDIEGIKALYSG